MNCRLEEPKIDETSPFKNCKLGREEYAQILTQIVDNYKIGCVLALNGEWGTGKTTFIKMWKQYLMNKDFKTLYFNVWEHDFISDPIVGLLGELKKLITVEKQREKFIGLASVASKALLSTLPGIAKGLAKKYLGEETEDSIEEGIKSITNYLSDEIDSYSEKCKSLEEFKNMLQDYVNTFISNKHPLIFFIDELDRCNPNYAVRVLERVKHLFNIPKIVFILSIDKEQLCNSIRGYFGSDRINTEEYLRRFIDVEYTMPEPDQECFIKYLIEKYDFNRYLLSLDTMTTGGPTGYKNQFIETLIILFKNMNLTLRDLEKFFNHLNIILEIINLRDKNLPDIILLCTYLKLFKEDVYNNIKSKEYSIDELVYVIETIFPHDFFKEESSSYQEYKNSTIYGITRLIAAYNCYVNERPISLYKSENDSSYNGTLLFKTKYLDRTFVHQSMSFFESSNFRSFYYILNKIFKQIELVEQLKV